jgi:cell division protein FtsB
MYLTEKDLKFEIRQVNATINELATDQAGDIRYLHQEVIELKEQIQMLTEQVEFLKDKINES